jgi:radical SAM-linked protein
LERALRRSGLPVSFTGGFHPLPRLQFALPLPLGVEGLGEWLDLELVAPVEPEAALAALKAVLPAEFALLSVASVPLAAPGLGQQLEAAAWRFSLRPAAGAEHTWPRPEQWQRAIATLLAREALIWHDQDKKGRPRQRDCRSQLLALRLAPPAAAGPPPPLKPAASLTLELEAAIDPQGRSLRPEQVVHWLAEALPQALPLELVGVCRQQLRLRAC